MNTVKFEVYNKKNKTFIDYSAFLTLPYKFADLLDEQLDEAKVELIGLPKAYVHPITNETIETAEVFNPFTLCRITISTSPECVYNERRKGGTCPDVRFYHQKRQNLS